MKAVSQSLNKLVKGFTLVELMISVALGIFLTAITIHFFINVKQINRYQQGSMRIYENIHAASLLLGRWVRNAGDFGCKTLDDDRVIHYVHDIDMNYLGIKRNMPIELVSSTEPKKLQPYLKQMTKRVKPKTDMLWMRRLDRLYPLISYTEGSNGFLKVVGHPSFKQGDIIAISDCQNIDFLKLADDAKFNIDNTSIIPIYMSDSREHLSKHYDRNAYVAKLRSEILYVASTNRTNYNGEPIFALYSTNLNGRTLELIEGVEDMQVEVYGDNSESPFKQSKNTKPIKAIRVNLLFNSIENAMFEAKLTKDMLIRKWWSQIWTIRSVN